MDPHRENGAHGPVSKKPRRSSSITFEEIQEEFSHHERNVARINNGSFGSCPGSVLAAQREWQMLFLSQPDDFYFNRLQPALLESRSVIKSIINAADVDEVSLVDNATTAAAIVLQKVSWAFSEGTFSRGDAVLMLHYAYGAVKKSIQAYVSRAGGHVIEVPLPFPVSSDAEIIDEFKKALSLGKAGGRKVRLAVIDHITSMPSVVIPVKELTRICREEGVDQVFVDAAHAIGNVKIDVQDIGADFYTSNLHKWFFCPPSVAFLYCRKSQVSDDMHHPVVSHEYGNGLAIESGWIGTRDYSAQLVVPEVIRFINRFEGGIEGIRCRNHKKVIEMGKMLALSWGTRLGSPPEMCSSMVMVGLPGCLKVYNDKDALRLRKYLREFHNVEVPIYCCKQLTDGEVERISSSVITGYARISYQVYNVVEDYERLKKAIDDIITGEFHARLLPVTD